MQPGRSAAFYLGRQIWRRWERLTIIPRDTQESFLLQLIRRNRATAFGREHGFGAVNGIDDYRRQVAVSDYEHLRPYIDRAKNGEAAVLTREPVFMFNMTSGSTGAPKLIPITATARKIHSRLTRLWFICSWLDHPRLHQGKMMGIVSAAVEGYTSSGIPYGSASGLIYRSSPWWVRRAQALPYEIAEIKDFTAKYYVAMRLAVEQNISFLGTPNPSTILRLVDLADRHREDIIRDIHDGGLSSRFDVAPEICAAIAPRIGANPERAKELERMAGQDGCLRPSSYWPELALIGCWTGGSVGIRLQEFAPWFGAAAPLRDLGYLASEAHVSLPIADHSPAGLLAIDANFYEFIPEAEIGSEKAATLLCDELEVGGVYYVILTTAGGLYRYDINDLVRVTGYHRKTPVIEFLRKGRDVTSLTGEKLHVNQVIQAMDEAQRATALRVRHFRACADARQSRYRFMVEFEVESPAPERLCRLLGELDRHLHQLNVEYAQKRQSRRLAPPLLHVMKLGWFERREQVRLRQGARDTQFKTRLLSDELEDENEIADTVESPDGDA